MSYRDLSKLFMIGSPNLQAHQPTKYQLKSFDNHAKPYMGKG